MRTPRQVLDWYRGLWPTQQALLCLAPAVVYCAWCPNEWLSLWVLVLLLFVPGGVGAVLAAGGPRA